MSRKKPKPPLRYFTFSPEMIHVTQQAMKLLVPLLARAEGQSEKVAFANETVQQVKSKLDAMRASVGTMCLTGFDYNEKLVIAAAIQLYMVDLRAASASSQREREMRRCQRIMRFALDPGREPGQ
jgi:hypothetical protein